MWYTVVHQWMMGFGLTTIYTTYFDFIDSKPISIVQSKSHSSIPKPGLSPRSIRPSVCTVTVEFCDFEVGNGGFWGLNLGEELNSIVLLRRAQLWKSHVNPYRRRPESPSRFSNSCSKASNNRSRPLPSRRLRKPFFHGWLPGRHHFYPIPCKSIEATMQTCKHLVRHNEGQELKIGGPVVSHTIKFTLLRTGHTCIP